MCFFTTRYGLETANNHREESGGFHESIASYCRQMSYNQYPSYAFKAVIVLKLSGGSETASNSLVHQIFGTQRSDVR